jgi:truncated hemoglobin YjbI
MIAASPLTRRRKLFLKVFLGGMNVGSTIFASHRLSARFGRFDLAVSAFGTGPHILEYLQDACNDIPHLTPPNAI